MEPTSSTNLDTSYTRLQEDDIESLEDGPQLVSSLAQSKTLTGLLIFNAILFVTSLCCLGLSISMYTDSLRINEKEILRQATFYSPPIDTLTPKWALQDFITHPVTSNESVFRQDPSLAVDAVWDRVADLGVIPLTHEQVVRLGKKPSTVAKAPAEWGMGNDAYLSQLDGIHLLQCLNSMRKSLHYNFRHYYPRGHSASYRAHLAHCQEALAHWLMCQPSLELITFNWVEKHETPFPDFDITRKCWDFEQLLAWQHENRIQSIHSAKWKTLRIPDGVEPNPSPLLNEETLNQTWVNVGECSS